jgi:hypothetical protein
MKIQDDDIQAISSVEKFSTSHPTRESAFAIETAPEVTRLNVSRRL